MVNKMNDNNRKYCFEPIIDKNCIVLILGSIPGEESLRKNEYYANSNNLFWDLIYSQYGVQVDSKYEEKCRFLLDRKIAIWDVLKAANREGSLDSNINSEIPNDIHLFLKGYPNIKHIFFNGTTSEKLFKKHFKDIYKNMHCKVLPSSSPTPGKYVKSIEEKRKEWQCIIFNKMEQL